MRHGSSSQWRSITACARRTTTVINEDLLAFFKA
jgi:hypothetical protein